MEAKQINISEVALDVVRLAVLVDQVQNKLEVVSDGRDGAIEEQGEEVNGVGVDARTLVASSMSNGVANVTWKGVGLVVWKWKRVGITQGQDSGSI